MIVFTSTTEYLFVSGEFQKQNGSFRHHWNNLRGRIPEIDDIFKDPNVAGALESILGENYVIHPHNFVHKAP